MWDMSLDFLARRRVKPDMRSVGVVFALLVLACNSSPTDPAQGAQLHDATITLQVGNSKQVNPDLRVSFADVLEDSRCPASVVCVWQGNAAIRLDVATSLGTQSVTLNTAGGTTFPREASAAGYTFMLMDLGPSPQTPDPIPLQQYRATIRVTRAG